MGISTRSSRRLADKSKSASAASSAGTPASTPAGPTGAIRKAVRMTVGKAKAAAARATASTAKVRSPRKKIAASADEPKIFPDVSIVDHDGEPVQTSEVFAEGPFIVFLYPRANTPGCTNQACGFRDFSDELATLGYRAFGLSYDSPKSQANWRNKHTLPYPLWCDTPSIGLIKALGAHKGSKSVKRSHFVVAKGGAIVDSQVQITPKTSVDLALDYARKHPANPEGATSAPVATDADAMDVDPSVPAEGSTTTPKSAEVENKPEQDAVMEDASAAKPAKEAVKDTDMTKESETPKQEVEAPKKEGNKSEKATPMDAEAVSKEPASKKAGAPKDISIDTQAKEADASKENVKTSDKTEVDAMETEKDTSETVGNTAVSKKSDGVSDVAKTAAAADGANKTAKVNAEANETKAKTPDVKLSTSDTANEGETTKEVTMQAVETTKEAMKKDEAKEDSTTPTAGLSTVAEKLADSAAAVPLAS